MVRTISKSFVNTTEDWLKSIISLYTTISDDVPNVIPYTLRYCVFASNATGSDFPRRSNNWCVNAFVKLALNCRSISPCGLVLMYFNSMAVTILCSPCNSGLKALNYLANDPSSDDRMSPCWTTTTLSLTNM